MNPSDVPTTTPTPTSTPEPTPTSTSTSTSTTTSVTTPTPSGDLSTSSNTYSTPDTSTTPNLSSPSNSSQQSASSSIKSGIAYAKTQKLALASLILGAVSMFIWILIFSGESGWNGFFSALFYVPVSVIITIICIVLLIMCIRNISKYKFQNKGFWIMPVLGVILSLAFWIWGQFQ